MKKLYIIGLGPGDAQFITPQAAQALEESQVVCGYTVYLDLIRDQCQEKEVITTPMTQEIAAVPHGFGAGGPGKDQPPWCAAATPASTAWPACCWSWRRNTRPWRSRWCPASRRRSAARQCWARRSSTILPSSP